MWGAACDLAPCGPVPGPQGSSWGRLLRDTEAGILLNEHVAEDGPTVFEHACRLGAEGIVSKRVDGTYRSGPCRVWNPASIAVQRERCEIWNRYPRQRTLAVRR
jgi:hypothetical protein